MVGKTVQKIIEGSTHGGDNHAIVFVMTDGSIYFVETDADYGEPSYLNPLKQVDEIPKGFIQD